MRRAHVHAEQVLALGGAGGRLEVQGPHLREGLVHGLESPRPSVRCAGRCPAVAASGAGRATTTPSSAGSGWPDRRPSRLLRAVVPVRGNPMMKRGARIARSSICGVPRARCPWTCSRLARCPTRRMRMMSEPSSFSWASLRRASVRCSSPARNESLAVVVQAGLGLGRRHELVRGTGSQEVRTSVDVHIGPGDVAVGLRGQEDDHHGDLVGEPGPAQIGRLMEVGVDPAS